MKRLMLALMVSLLLGENAFAELEEDQCYRIKYFSSLKLYVAKCEEKDGKYILYYRYDGRGGGLERVKHLIV